MCFSSSETSVACLPKMYLLESYLFCEQYIGQLIALSNGSVDFSKVLTDDKFFLKAYTCEIICSYEQI